MNDICLFCKIIAKEIPSSKVYEDENCYAFLDLHPVNIGHTLLVPKKHSANLYEMDNETLAILAPVIKKVAIAVKSALNADGINIEMNNDPIAGQIIFHSHIHIVPRFEGDGFRHWRGARDYREGEMNEVAQKISSTI
ncbi:MAG: HIT family hydrolase [Candidatus Yonathbacteria bacterium RIFCSPLOWO2_01_FULL_43_27]|uniref:HIT family hydrolase n=2 Tax=Parcubacteria group TaxID=1794811 RepID=A0A1G2SET4_9BACT|nr:MAG: Histidine triad family protein [Candidatus Azambacteria bacterium GW2011_GWA1_44_9]OHA78719.1 MAG: HIT family hydrolase [Candidatus Yonathbacteria bacterium RIFCSPHIGHO2_01_FULL_44_19]OHA83182.1 MAG: HIT family hydrolase [Candidatus Yonathbacteria bacterium RIFCSPLOWO2_01_FULL_43_27]